MHTTEEHLCILDCSADSFTPAIFVRSTKKWVVTLGMWQDIGPLTDFYNWPCTRSQEHFPRGGGRGMIIYLGYCYFLNFQVHFVAVGELLGFILILGLCLTIQVICVS